MSYKITSLDHQVNKSQPSTIPKIPFSHYIVGGKGAGKTTLLLNLLQKSEFYKKAFHKIYWVSPTNHLDEKINSVRDMEITSPNYPLWKRLKEDKKQSILSDPIEIPNKPTASPVEFFDALDLGWLSGLVEAQKMIVSKYGKRLSNKVLLILDDSISNKVLKTSTFRNFLLNSRHFNISTIFVSQSYMLLERNIRINNSFTSVFEVSNLENLKQIYNENSVGLPWDTWKNVYDLCVEEDYGFMSISYQNDKQHRIIRNYEEFLIVE